MDCLIHIVGVAESEGRDTTEMECRGSFRMTESGNDTEYRFDYRNVESDNPADVSDNRVVITGEKAVITRRGSVNSEMIVVPGESHPCLYETGFGTLSFEIAGKEVTVVREENRVIAGMVYDIVAGGNVVSSNTIRLIAEWGDKTE